MLGTAFNLSSVFRASRVDMVQPDIRATGILLRQWQLGSKDPKVDRYTRTLVNVISSRTPVVVACLIWKVCLRAFYGLSMGPTLT